MPGRATQGLAAHPLRGREIRGREVGSGMTEVTLRRVQDETSPLAGEIKMLGTGRGRVSQAPLAEEIVDLLETVEKLGGGARTSELRQGAKRFFLNYV